MRGRRRGSANEINPLLGNQALPVPGTVLQIQQTESREIPGIGVNLTAEDEVTKAIRTRQGIAHADSIEQSRSREFCVGHGIAQRTLHRVHGKQRIVILVIPERTRLTQQSATAGTCNRARAGPICQPRSRRIFHAIAVNGIQAARHVHHVAQGNRISWVVHRVLEHWQPVDAQRFIQRHPTVINQHADQRRRNTFRR